MTGTPHTASHAATSYIKRMNENVKTPGRRMKTDGDIHKKLGWGQSLTLTNYEIGTEFQRLKVCPYIFIPVSGGK